MLGDFNTYIDYEYPIDLLTNQIKENSRCIPIWDKRNMNYREQNLTFFHDIWKTLHPDDLGNEAFVR